MSLYINHLVTRENAICTVVLNTVSTIELLVRKAPTKTKAT